jgi:transposase
VPGAQAAGPGAQKTFRAEEQDRADLAQERAAWRAELARVDPERLVVLDESGIDTRLTRTHARAVRGKRALGTVPWGHWKRLTVIGALARDGVIACMSIAAATSTAVFRAFVEQVLTPALRDRPGAIVVMDNLAAHKAEAVRKALDAARIAYRYLPAYSPDLNPIEPCWSKLKSRLRAKAARTLDALDIELGPALATVTAQDAQGWFRLCGYATPN